jgi:Fe-S cluster assembly protein SufD
MTEALAAYRHYLEDYRRGEGEAAREPAWLRDLRRRAMEAFQRIGLPTARKGNEPWKYTNIAPIAQSEFHRDGAVALDQTRLRRAAPWDESWAPAVFVNGRLKAKPPEAPGALLADLGAFADGHSALVEAHLGRYAPFEDDGFLALNTALFTGGALVYVPAGLEAPAPVHLVFASQGSEGALASYPRTLIVAGENSRLTVIETYVGLQRGARYLTDSVTEIVLGEGAQVEHYRVLLESDASYHVGMTRVWQGKDSRFSSTAFQRGAALARNDLRVTLAAPGGSCQLHGLYVTNGREHIDNYINIDHAAPHTASRLYYKGILDGQSHAIFGGIVLVRPGAVKVDAHQADKNLLLSPEAEVDSKPSLEIYADDVKCGHGATAGAIAEDALFYLRSRGLDLKTASALLIKGFASEILEAVALRGLRHDLEQRVKRALRGATFWEGV